MANFGSKNETFAYLVGKDIAEIKAKIEGIGATGGGLDVLKVVVPAATEEQVNAGVMAEVGCLRVFKTLLFLWIATVHTTQQSCVILLNF